jgi:hypothetical protein
MLYEKFIESNTQYGRAEGSLSISEAKTACEIARLEGLLEGLDKGLVTESEYKEIESQLTKLKTEHNL